ncbi:Histone-lysine N-methyltransferase ATXR3-like protein [Drosera capensis]
MGDGGVACIPAHDIMVKFPVVSDSFCGGGGSSGGGGSNVNNNNSSSNSNNESNGKLEAKPIKITGTKRMKLKRDAFLKKEEPPVQAKKGEVGGQTGENEEVEEGELGTMISPKEEMRSSDGPSTVEKVLKSGSEVDAVKERKVEQVNGEVLPAKKRKGKAKKKGQIGTGSLRSDAVTRRERTLDFQWRRERSPDFVPRRKRSPEFSWRRERSPSFNAGWRNRSPDKYSKGISKRDEALSPVGADDDEIERGEFIPDEFHNGELSRDDHSNNHRRDGSRDSDRRNALDYTPPPGKYSVEDISPGRKSGNQHRKRPARSEAHQDKNHLKMNLKVDEVSLYKNDPNHGNNHGKEHSSSASRLKRHDTDSEGDGRKHHEDHSDYVSSKSRRLSGDSFRSARTEHLSNRSVESSGKDPPSSRINSERQSLRRYDSYSSRTNDSHGRSSPYRSERSPHDRARYRDHRERTPVTRERSPDRGGRNHYHRNQTPNNSTRSPESGPRAHDRRNQSPSVLEGSQHDRKRSNNSDQVTSSQLESKETRQNQSSLEKEVKDRDTNRRSSVSAKEPESGRNLDNESVHKNLTCHADKESHHEIPSIPSMDQHLQEDGAIEELPSMEEDMDICDTPPHVSAAVSIDPGKWVYLDYFGVELGPSRLCDLKTLVDGGFLATDHFIKHIDSDRWMTVENAASPLVTLNFSTVVPDDVSQLVSPPEAAGNLLTDTMDAEHANGVGMDVPVALEQRTTCSSENSDVSDVSVDLRIVERVDALMEDISILPGKELEILGEILKTTFNHPGHEIWNTFEDTGDTVLFPHAEDLSEQNGDAPPGFPDKAPADAAEPTSSAGMDVDGGKLPAEFNEWFSCRWSCRGGDWRKNDDGVQDKYSKKKIVLNDGYPLCQMLKSEYEDPRSSEIDDLYSTSQSSKFELPVWAFSWPDEQSDSSISGKPGQAKVALPKGVKGTMLPVVRINACVVNEHDSSSSDARLRNRGKDRYPSKFVRPCPSPGDNIRSNTEDSSHLNHRKDDCDSTPINVSKDHILTKDELQLHLGGWYFLDGAGRENGPFPLSQLHLLVDQGLIQKCSSVFRKIDNVWVPVTSAIGAFQNTNKLIEDHRTSVNDSSGALLYAEEGELHETNIASSSVHDTYPQFIGYTRGKLHELVMRFYKSREFAAAINEVLDPWINARQPKKESEKHSYLQKSALESESSLVHQGHLHAAKRARLMAEGSVEEYEMENNSRTFLDDIQPFEDLCGNVSFFESKAACSKVMDGSWGLLDGHILARIFHFLRGDTRSIVFAYSTCKHWREAVGFYRGISRLVNVSSIGNKCTDSVFRSIMGGYDEGKIRSLVLVGCGNISSGILEDILSSFSCISFIDIRGCAQLDELTIKFSNLNWVTGHSVQSTGTFENSYFRIPSSKQMADEISSVSRSSIGSSYMDDSSGLEVYFDMVDKKRDAANQAFRQSLYKRSKLYDARRSLSILAREAHMRRWAMKKPGNGYKRTEEFLLNSLKEITQDKTYDFFVPRVTEIEGRIKSGYYASRGIAYVKEDINKLCKDAKKMRNRDSGDTNHIIKMLNKLSAGLEVNSRRVIDKDQMMKTLKDDSVGISKHKKPSKPKTDRKKMSRSNSSSITYGGPDYMEYSDRESGRRLSKSKLKSVESGTDSSDEFEASSDDARSNSDSMGSETESDLDMRTDVGFGDSRAGYVISDEDSMTDDREWGARMTKASLVPPVTRKYEVIEEYAIVADEDEVSRKMRVSLPDDYDEKVKAQKNGVEESDMEIPEMKEFKPRKQLGDEVIEQEVFGIDPYTHNLLLDSMPDDEDWSIPEKHIFIEDVLLRTLNMQVRHFTGSGNTPMVYTLKPVLEEIIEKAKKERDLKTMKLCQAILDAINRRPDDNYVAYRKGLGVVCNKEGGFGGDDFVVEFLGEVYPAWKWFEKQDGIRSLQKNSKDTAPEFYNINLERPKGDADGYDLVVVDAMHKANYASRICHSCRPNCEAKVTAVDGYYQIGIYTVRPIGFGEEVTFDYNSVTESKEEYEASVCLCGSQVCRGSYLNLVGEGAFLKVLKEWHGLLDRHRLMLEACELNWVSEEDYIDLSRAGLGSCLLGGLPDWLIAYSARLVRFINFERTKLPDEILRHNVEEKKKYFAEICYEVEKSDAEIQAEGVYNQRLQNLALTLDKVRYVMRCAFGDPKKAPPPLRKLRPEEMVSFIWKGSGSFVEELLQCIGPHMEDGVLDTLRSKIRSHDPSGSDDVERELQKSLVLLRDEVRNLQCTHKCRHDAAADLIHIYAYTKSFFKIREYKAVTSPPVHISPLDLGPKCADKISGFTEYRKTYGENYCLGQLIYWYNQANADPDRKLARASRGCLSLPDIGSFYAKAQKPARQRVYGPRTVRFMTARMEKQPQRPWPEDRIWSFKTSPKVFGSPMLDAVLNNSPLERDMVNWLKNRPAVYHALSDR